MADFRILVASDIHCGYGENKKGISEDSFVGLEEVLETAVKKKVDFLLLGGDLFHENNPSRYTQHRVLSLLRKYCMSDAPVEMEMLSEPKENFEHSQFKIVNYEDPNYNIGLPIFSIHGNHDDFSGKGLLALDVLHDLGLVNLFGKYTNVDDIVVSPILLRKGNTQIALYGIGSQRDDRLARALAAKKVKFLRPVDQDSWFNILVLHQNRPPRSTTRSTGSYVPMSLLPEFMNLIVWGHEHACQVDTELPYYEHVNGGGFHILQPGSTVATSICPDETIPKKLGLLEITGKKFRVKPISMTRVRQVILDELDLAKEKPEGVPASKSRKANMVDEKLIKRKIDEMLRQARKELGPHQPALPRMRLKVHYSEKWLDIPPVNPRQIGLHYAKEVANPADLIVVKKSRSKEEEDDDKESVHIPQVADDTTLYDILQETLLNDKNSPGLGVLSLRAMQDITAECYRIDGTQKDKDDLFERSLNTQIDNYLSRFKNIDVDESSGIAAIRKGVEDGIERVKNENRKELQRDKDTRLKKKRDAAMSVVETDGEEKADSDEDVMMVDEVKQEVDSDVVRDSLEFPGFMDD